MEVPSEADRCKRMGSKWRCPSKSLPGKIYCEKHHLYNVTRTNRRKNKIASPVAKCGLSSSTTAVEPYRPVIDFTAVEEKVVSGVGGDGGEKEFVMDWLLGEIDGGGGCGNDYFTLPELGFGEGIFGSFGTIDDHDLGNQLIERELEGGRRYDKFTIGEPGGVGPAQLGDFTRYAFSEGDNCILTGKINNEVCENQEFNVVRNDMKCGESNTSRQEFSILEQTQTSVGSNNVSLGKGIEGQFGESGCNENNVIVMGMEARSGLVRREEMVGKVQKRKRP